MTEELRSQGAYTSALCSLPSPTTVGLTFSSTRALPSFSHLGAQLRAVIRERALRADGFLELELCMSCCQEATGTHWPP